MSKRFSLFLLIIPILFVSCDKNAVSDQSVFIHNEIWNADSLATFSIPISDTLSQYNLYVDLRNSNDYPFQNLFLFVNIYAPNGAFLRDTFECFLANEHGDWLGKGRGRIRDNRFLYRKDVKFSSSGSYRFEIQQAMRVQELKGLVNVGIRVEKENTSK